MKSTLNEEVALSFLWACPPNSINIPARFGLYAGQPSLARELENYPDYLPRS